MSKKKKDPAVYIWDMLYEIDFIEQAMERGNLHDLMVSHACFGHLQCLARLANE